MTKKKAHAEDEELGLGDDPLAGADSDPLAEHFYRRAPPTSTSTSEKPKRAKVKGRQPLKEGRTFRLVTFSFYEEDVARLDALLDQAKKNGHKRVSRSQIVRLALRRVDVGDLPEVI